MDNKTKTIGPYSRFVKPSKNKQPIFFSGVIGNDKITGKIEAKTLEEELQILFENLQRNLDEAETKINDIVKVTVFLIDMKNYAFFNILYSKFMKDHKPARSCVEVRRIPANANFEIEVIAFV